MIAMGPGFCSELVLLELVAVYYLLILAVGVERVVELMLSRRNAKWAFAHGGREFGRGHYPSMVAIHIGLLVGCVVEVWLLHRPFLPWLGLPMLALTTCGAVPALVVHRDAGTPVEHAGDRSARRSVGAARAVSLVAPPELPGRRGRRYRAAVGAYRLGDGDSASPWPMPCC